MKGKDRAEWLADKICNSGDYAKEAALVLVQQAVEIDRLRADRDPEKKWRKDAEELREELIAAAVAAERARCARVCDDEQRMRVEAGAKHGAGTHEFDRCMAAARGAANCACGVRSGEEV